MVDTDEVEKLKNALVLAEEALEDAERDRDRLARRDPIDTLVGALWTLLPAEAVAAFQRSVNEHVLPIPPAPPDTERALREESESRLAEIQALTKALREEERARAELQARLGIPSIVRNVKARCHSCGAEVITAASGEPLEEAALQAIKNEPVSLLPAEAFETTFFTAADTAALEALSNAQIYESPTGVFMFQDTDSERSVCRAEVNRRVGRVHGA